MNETAKVKADKWCRLLQWYVNRKMKSGRPANSFEPGAPSGSRVRDDGVRYTNDCRYGVTYPNSYLDIWYPTADTSTIRPTIVYFHGGGFIFGDKVAGDPFAADHDQADGVFTSLLQAGFNVVRAGYALAPGHRFPVQIHQVDQVLDYLQHNALELGLDMGRVVLIGGSAGADLVEIYGLALVDQDYAAGIGLMPSIAPERVKALVIDEAALHADRFGNWRMDTLFKCWLGVNDLTESAAAKLIDVPTHVNGAYPPAFIITSNTEPWFVTSALDLQAALERDGLPHELFYRDKEVEELEHGFLNRLATSPSAKECFDSMVDFINEAVAHG